MGRLGEDGLKQKIACQKNGERDKMAGKSA